MKSLPIIGLGLGTLGLGISHQAVQGSQIPSVPGSMLNAYGVLMNDWELLEQGQMGIERLRSDPSDLHRKKGVEGKRVPNPSRERIRDIRDIARKQKVELGDGLIRAGSGKIVFWYGSNAAPDEAHQLRARKEVEDVASEAASAIRRHPNVEFRRKLMGGTFVAKAIRFESPKCLSCHEGAKQNGVAAIAAVVYRPLKPPIDPRAKVQENELALESVPREFGLNVYPSRSTTPTAKLYETMRIKSAFVAFRTKDSAMDVMDLYRKALATKPGIFMQQGDGWLSYEFGDSSYGRIRTSVESGETLVHLNLQRLIK